MDNKEETIDRRIIFFSKIFLALLSIYFIQSSAIKDIFSSDLYFLILTVLLIGSIFEKKIVKHFLLYKIMFLYSFIVFIFNFIFYKFYRCANHHIILFYIIMYLNLVFYLKRPTFNNFVSFFKGLFIYIIFTAFLKKITSHDFISGNFLGFHMIAKFYQDEYFGKKILSFFFPNVFITQIKNYQTMSSFMISSIKNEDFLISPHPYFYQLIQLLVYSTILGQFTLFVTSLIPKTKLLFKFSLLLFFWVALLTTGEFFFLSLMAILSIFIHYNEKEIFWRKIIFIQSLFFIFLHLGKIHFLLIDTIRPASFFPFVFLIFLIFIHERIQIGSTPYPPENLNLNRLRKLFSSIH
jgi:hypothetical protein